MNDARMPLVPGTELDGGRYEIVEQLGRGGFGIAYQATDRTLACSVVLKEYYPKDGTLRRGEEVAFVAEGAGLTLPATIVAQEALSALRVRHPAVAKTLGVFAEKGTAYIAMEWIEGKTLLKAKRAGQLTPDLLLKIYLTVLDAALCFSEAGFAHRDLNPNNIMITREGDPVVIDFGLARPVGVGYAHLARTAGFVEGLEPPEQRDEHGDQGLWTDVFTLSATVFYLVAGRFPKRSRDGELVHLWRAEAPRLTGFGRSFVECIDAGLVKDIDERLQSGGEALSMLGLERGDLQRILSPQVFSHNYLMRQRAAAHSEASSRAKSKDADSDVKVTRYQTCLLQSFDTARFQRSSVKREDGSPLSNAVPAKIALARTEALLNVLFGREIVVPAGQIADSPAFFALFRELIPHYEARRAQIAAASAKADLPLYKPMRLALEKRAMQDYAGFVRAYEYTGATLPLLDIVGKPEAEQTKDKTKIEGFKHLFLAQQYAALEKAVGIDGYGEFARSVRGYFDDETAVFARAGIPEVSATDYREVFERRLRDDRISGVGIEEARATLPIVEKIQSDLRQTKAVGFRGNWYLYSTIFKEAWPLARAYLDFRLFVSLARQYGVDHPILISQEFEYGRYDHSLMLGPRFSQTVVALPYDSTLMDLASHFASPIDWGAVFDLYAEPRFLQSIRHMNESYLSGKREHDYVARVSEHGEVINRHLASVVSISSRGGRLCLSAGPATSGATILYEAYDPIAGQRDVREQDRAMGRGMSCFGDMHKNVSVGTLTSDQLGSPSIDGSKASKAILHYFAKPYRMLAASRE
ncbi:MAG TPA: serine/threonine-protein kinase [Polyangiaceae bacterium]|nr:serine/threonine-protein kinase [Polyangiaceae bacterium]